MAQLWIRESTNRMHYETEYEEMFITMSANGVGREYMHYVTDRDYHILMKRILHKSLLKK